MSRIFFFFLLLLFMLSGARAAYETVAPGAPLYGQLHTVTQAGWTNAARETGSAAVGSNAANALTRYEIALETAKAIFAVTARHQAEADWVGNAPRPAVRALRELSATLRPELQKLDIDVPQVLAMLDEILSAPASDSSTLTAQWSTPVAGEVETPKVATTSTSPRATLPNTQVAGAPISQRLHLYTALSTAARGRDALSQPSWIMRGAAANPAPANRAATGATGLGAAISITDWMRLRAGYANRLEATPSFMRGLAPDGANGLDSRAALGGGLDISLGAGLTLSAEMARIKAETLLPGLAGALPNGTRVGGGVGLSAWQNRLVLNANLARLIPEREGGDEAATAGVDLGLNLSENLRLRLLYQQLFSPQTPTRAERIIAGGLSVQF